MMKKLLVVSGHVFAAAAQEDIVVEVNGRTCKKEELIIGYLTCCDEAKFNEFPKMIIETLPDGLEFKSHNPDGKCWHGDDVAGQVCDNWNRPNEEQCVYAGDDFLCARCPPPVVSCPGQAEQCTCTLEACADLDVCGCDEAAAKACCDAEGMKIVEPVPPPFVLTGPPDVKFPENELKPGDEIVSMAVFRELTTMPLERVNGQHVYIDDEYTEMAPGQITKSIEISKTFVHNEEAGSCIVREGMHNQMDPWTGETTPYTDSMTGITAENFINPRVLDMCQHAGMATNPLNVPLGWVQTFQTDTDLFKDGNISLGPYGSRVFPRAQLVDCPRSLCKCMGEAYNLPILEKWDQFEGRSLANEWVRTGAEDRGKIERAILKCLVVDEEPVAKAILKSFCDRRPLISELNHPNHDDIYDPAVTQHSPFFPSWLFKPDVCNSDAMLTCSGEMHLDWSRERTDKGYKSFKSHHYFYYMQADCLPRLMLDDIGRKACEAHGGLDVNDQLVPDTLKVCSNTAAMECARDCYLENAGLKRDDALVKELCKKNNVCDKWLEKFGDMGDVQRDCHAMHKGWLTSGIDICDPEQDANIFTQYAQSSGRNLTFYYDFDLDKYREGCCNYEIKAEKAQKQDAAVVQKLCEKNSVCDNVGIPKESRNCGAMHSFQLDYNWNICDPAQDSFTDNAPFSAFADFDKLAFRAECCDASTSSPLYGDVFNLEPLIEKTSKCIAACAANVPDPKAEVEPEVVKDDPIHDDKVEIEVKGDDTAGAATLTVGAIPLVLAAIH